jgi:hypothetical protein
MHMQVNCKAPAGHCAAGQTFSSRLVASHHLPSAISTCPGAVQLMHHLRHAGGKPQTPDCGPASTVIEKPAFPPSSQPKQTIMTGLISLVVRVNRKQPATRTSNWCHTQPCSFSNALPSTTGRPPFGHCWTNPTGTAAAVRPASLLQSGRVNNARTVWWPTTNNAQYIMARAHPKADCNLQCHSPEWSCQPASLADVTCAVTKSHTSHAALGHRCSQHPPFFTPSTQHLGLQPPRSPSDLVEPAARKSPR